MGENIVTNNDFIQQNWLNVHFVLNRVFYAFNLVKEKVNTLGEDVSKQLYNLHIDTDIKVNDNGTMDGEDEITIMYQLLDGVIEYYVVELKAYWSVQQMADKIASDIERSYLKMRKL